MYIFFEVLFPSQARGRDLSKRLRRHGIVISQHKRHGASRLCVNITCRAGALRLRVCEQRIYAVTLEREMVASTAGP